MIISKSNKNSDKNSPIALFDSGVGGLTVLKQLKEVLPNETYIYYGDTLHMPYGDKSEEQLLQYSSKIFEYFEKRNCKAVVMACNTTSSVVYEQVKDMYNFKLFSIVHAVSEVLASLDIKKLGVFATKATVESGAYNRKIAEYNPNIEVFGQFCPKWVHFVEENSMNEPKNKKEILADLEKMLENNPDKILLGCTHYPFLLDILSSGVQKDLFIDPSLYFAQYIKRYLHSKDLLATHVEEDEFYVSENPEQFVVSAQMFYKLAYLPKVLTF